MKSVPSIFAVIGVFGAPDDTSLLQQAAIKSATQKSATQVGELADEQVAEQAVDQEGNAKEAWQWGQGQPRRRSWKPRPLDCTSPLAEGDGSSFFNMFHYDARSMSCTAMTFRDGNGFNGNRYFTEADCLQKCLPGPTYVGTNGCLDTPVSAGSDQCSGDEVKTIGPRSYGGCQTCTCSNDKWECEGVARIRKEIFNYDDDEFARFADAVNTLKRSGEWDKIVQIHGIVERDAHRSNKFLHWHRKYLFDLETMVQAAANSCDVTLPYWNWGYDMGEQGAQVQHVWGPRRYGALDTGNPEDLCGFEHCGQPIGNAQHPSFIKDRCPFAGGRRVTDGLFGAGSAFDIYPDSPMPFGLPPPMDLAEAAANAVDQPFGAIHRCWSGGPVNTQSIGLLNWQQEQWFGTGNVSNEFPLNPGTVNSQSGRTHPRCDTVIGAVPPGCCMGCPQPPCPPCNPDAPPCTGPLTLEMVGLVDGVDCTRNGMPDYGFVTFVETQWHNTQHCAIGGYMCGFYSPHDPIFWAHHAFVDKVWFDWQETHLTPEQEDWTDSAGDFTLPWNVCGPEPPASDATIPASDVENARNMFDGKGKVTYVDRDETLHCSAYEFRKVQCCAQVLSRTNAWRQVKRLATSADSAEDVCSPVNAGAASSTQLWMHTLVDAGCMSQEQADGDYRSDMEFLTHLNDHVDSVLRTDASACEKSLCMPLDQYFETCEVHGPGIC